MAYPFSQVAISIPLVSGDGKYYGRYPNGDKPLGAAHLQGAAADAIAAAASLSTTPGTLAGAASDTVSGAGTLVGSAVTQALGMNLSAPSYGVPGNSYLNFMKKSSQYNGVYHVQWQSFPSNSSLETCWTTMNGGQDTSEQGCLQLDADGYVTSLTASPIPPGGQKFTTVQTRISLGVATVAGTAGPYEGGPCTIQGTGAGTFTWGGSDVSNCVGNGSTVTVSGNTFTSTATGAWTATCTITPSAGGFYLTISAINATNPLKVISLVQNAYLASFNGGEIWHPNMLKMCANFTSFRFMKPCATENNIKQIQAGANPSGTSATLRDACTITGYVSGGVLTVTAVSSYLYFGTYYTGAGISANARIITQLSGGGGGVGTYSVTNSGDTAGSAGAPITMTGLGTWMWQTKTLRTVFSSGEQRDVNYTAHSNQITWSPALTVANTDGYMYVNDRSQWSQRQTLTSCAWANPMGLPFEAAINLCNKIGADFLCNIPLMAGWSNPTTFDATQYITPLNTLVKAQLNSPNRFFLETDNEVWNYGYNSQPLACRLGLANWPGNGLVNNSQYNRNWYGKNCALIAQQCQTDWGANFSRCYPSLGAQHYDSSSFTSAMNTNYWFTSNAQRASDFATYPIKTALIAPYFGGMSSSFSQVYPTAATEAMFTTGRTLAQQLDDWFAMQTGNVLHSFTFTGAVSAAATSATLSAGVWTGAPISLTIQFSTGTQKLATFTNNSSTVTWSGALGGVGATATVNFIAIDQFTNGGVGISQQYLGNYTAIVGPGKTYPSIKLAAYEGGPNHGFGGNPSAAWLAIMVAGMQDARMATVVQNFQQYWATNVGAARENAFHYFILWNNSTGSNQYGAASADTQSFIPISTAPAKWRGLQNYMGYT